MYRHSLVNFALKLVIAGRNQRMLECLNKEHCTSFVPKHLDVDSLSLSCSYTFFFPEMFILADEWIPSDTLRKQQFPSK